MPNCSRDCLYCICVRVWLFQEAKLDTWHTKPEINRCNAFICARLCEKSFRYSHYVHNPFPVPAEFYLLRFIGYQSIHSLYSKWYKRSEYRYIKKSMEPWLYSHEYNPNDSSKNCLESSVLPYLFSFVYFFYHQNAIRFIRSVWKNDLKYELTHKFWRLTTYWA